MARRRRFFAVVFLVLFIALGGLNSCGGGTVGTDVGGATRILGRVVSTAWPFRPILELVPLI